ncbi:MAG: hypothetical protein MJ048_05920 [Acidaminococcaceae bacterium]|nr:hypothetical protein [Acidaminococcaceae bacterium]
MKFKVCIEEIVSEEFEIEASDAGEVLEIAEQKYFEGILVPKPGNLCSTQIAIIKPDNEVCEWVEIYPKYKHVTQR